MLKVCVESIYKDTAFTVFGCGTKVSNFVLTFVTHQKKKENVLPDFDGV